MGRSQSHRIGVLVTRWKPRAFCLCPQAHTKRSWEHTARCTSKEETPQNGTYVAGTLILDITTPEPWEVSFCCLSHSPYSSLVPQTKTHHCYFYWFLAYNLNSERAPWDSCPPPNIHTPVQSPPLEYGQDLWPASRPEIIAKVKGFCRGN